MAQDGESVPAPRSVRPNVASVIFSHGFRTFFLLAAIFSPLAVAAWIGIYSGAIKQISAYPPSLWHAHEMLFGYTAAVLTGFLLTAIPNWTGAAPLRGRPLVVLALLWLAGRASIWLMPVVPPAVAAAIDVSFFIVLGLLLVPSLMQGARKNLVFLAVLTFLAAANLLFHLQALGFGETGSLGLNLGVDLFALLISIIGGRVTPAFTANALRARAEAEGAPPLAIKSHPALDKAAVLSVAAIAICEFFFSGNGWIGWVALAAAAINAVRLAGWQARHTLSQPLLWVLHLGYAWLVAGLAIKGFAALTAAIPATVALHGITIGAIGTMTLAMMSRASLGHTGRALSAGRALVFAYVLISLAAVARLTMPLIFPDRYFESVMIAGTLWVTAFAVFAVLFIPILVRPRADRRPE